MSRGSPPADLEHQPILAALESGAHLGGEDHHAVEDGLPLFAPGQLHPGVRKRDGEELEAPEITSLHRDAEQKRPVVAQARVYGVIVYKVAGIVEDRLPT